MSESRRPIRSLLSKTLLGGACLSLQPLLLNALSVPVMAYIIRQLGPRDYGQWAVATSLLAVSAVLTNLGLRGTFVRAVAAEPDSAEPALADQLGLRLVLAVISTAAVLGACALLGYPVVVLKCAALGAAGLGLTTFASTLGDLMQSMQRVKTLAAVNFLAGLVLTTASLFAAFFGGGAVAVAAAYMTGPLISAVIMAVLVSRHCCAIRIRWSIPRFRELLISSRFFAVQQLLAVGGAQAEALLLPRWVGMRQFGFFTAGTLLATRLTALPDGLCTAAYPAMAAARGQRQGASLAAWCLFIAAVGGSLIAVCGVLAAQPLGCLLFPKEPALFAAVVKITIWSLPLFGAESVMGYAINAAGADKEQARVSAPAAVAGLAMSVLMVMGFGVTGACWSMLLRPAIRSAFLAPVFIRTFWQTSDIPALCAAA